LETLGLRRGSCRDFAMLMIEAACSFGFAARFASGYLAVPLDDPQEATSGSARGSTHAWAQIYLPGGVGNIGLVTVATAPDSRHLISLHGTFFGFPSDHLGMEVQVRVMSGTPE
jgi:transglutaminase-like putative cysteine protease